MGQQTSAVRKDIYAYLNGVGVDVKGEKHKELKQLLMAHADSRTEDLLERISQLEHEVGVLKVFKEKKYSHK